MGSRGEGEREREWNRWREEMGRGNRAKGVYRRCDEVEEKEGVQGGGGKEVEMKNKTFSSCIGLYNLLNVLLDLQYCVNIEIGTS